jgi:hypothetical protein
MLWEIGFFISLFFVGIFFVFRHRSNIFKRDVQKLDDEVSNDFEEEFNLNSNRSPEGDIESAVQWLEEDNQKQVVPQTSESAN